MARMLDKEKAAFLGALAMGGLLAGMAALHWTVSHPLDFGARGPGTHVPVEPASIPFAGAEFARYWEEGGANPFTLVSDRRDLPPSDIPLPPVAATAPQTFPPSPWPAGDPGPWAGFDLPAAGKPLFTLASGFDLPDLQGLVPPPAPASADPGANPDAGKGDVVLKRDGSTLKGKILSQSDTEIVIQTTGGRQKVDMKEVASFDWKTATPKQRYESDAAKLDPKDADGHQKEADLCEKNGLVPEAVKEWEAVLKADPKRLAACFALGDLYRRAMDLDGEMGLYRRICATGGSGGEKVWIRLGKLLAALGLREDAIAAYEAGVKAYPVAIDAKMELALALARVGRIEEAATLADRAEKGGSGDARCPVVRGLVEFERGNDPEADKLLPSADVAADADAALARGVLGVRAARKDPTRLADAATAFKKALQLSPTSTDAWVDLGLCLLLAGKNAEADLCFSTATALDPSIARAECGRGLVALALAKLDEAAARFDTAAKLDPTDGYPSYALGKARLEQGNADEAWKALLAASKAGGRTPDLAVSLGLAALAKQDHADAIAFLEGASREGGASGGILAALGIAKLGRGDGQGAYAAFKDALKVDPNNVAALSGLGYYFYFGKQPAEAQRNFNDVLKIDAANAYATDANARVTETASRTLWEDNFDREDRAELGRQWNEIERSGVEITLKDKRAKFGGRQGVKDDEMTTLDQPVKLKGLLRFEVELDTTDLGEATAGVRLIGNLDGAGRMGGVLFARNEHGKWAWTATEDLSQIVRWTELPGGPDSPVFRVTLQRMDAPQGQVVFAVIVNDKLVVNMHAEFLDPIDKGLVGVFGSAGSGTAWTLCADGVKIIEKKGKKK